MGLRDRLFNEKELYEIPENVYYVNYTYLVF